MKLIGLVRLGQDAEIRYTQDGTPVCNLRLAYDYGRKDSQGNQPTQWIDGSLWGTRGEKLQPHLTQGKALVVTLSDVHAHTFDKRDGGTGVVLRARVDDVQFAGGARSERRPQPQQPQQPPPAPPEDDMDFDDDIPF